MKNVQLAFLTIVLLSVFLVSCGGDDEPTLTASVTINATGSDLGGDVTGNGGSTSETFTWNNPSTKADWNMDITSTEGGTFQLEIADADGAMVLNRTLVSGQGDDSASGVTASGTSGDWSVTVTLTNFNGDGSFSISPGD